MSDPYFFGYGSLVKCQTHNYPKAQKARLHGWARAWVSVAQHDVTLLTAVPASPDTRIDGLIAAVPNADWQALDARESGYARIASPADVAVFSGESFDIAHYAVAPENMQKNSTKPILLSYLDVVVQGYFREFGPKGVVDFFDTTSGWETPILDDRAAPRYPRYQRLTPQETRLVDSQIARVGAKTEVFD